jgi:hypothetical protein
VHNLSTDFAQCCRSKNRIDDADHRHYLLRQIEQRGKLKNFTAQFKEGAKAERLMRP